ncbi:hypothetical protein Bhyg_14474 [Pseudolycoriella hygida]|uniref:Uncharacterized protein n=1 Tax=Pseudolycoriella hygida TaxID=35572 RepID=A0A9Q0RXG7_9DIPT|nr:hypothetical protein Bhyg_14474 [Pseudolycoriella hygida]
MSSPSPQQSITPETYEIHESNILHKSKDYHYNAGFHRRRRKHKKILGKFDAEYQEDRQQDLVTMKSIEAAIHAKVESMIANNLIFKYLSDESIPPTERLARVTPRLAYFALAFQDLQAYVLKYPDEEAKSDRIKAAINAHCVEDSNHWPLFLADLKTLGLDAQTTYTSAFKSLWGKEARIQRYSCYDLAILASQAKDPILRFAFLLSQEINGHAVFSKFLEVAEKSEMDTGKELFYYGRTHYLRETGGLHGQEDIENELLQMKLSPEMRAKAMDIVMKQLDIQNAEWNDLAVAALANKKW